MKIAVYSAIINNYDLLKDGQYKEDGVDFILFTDNQIASDTWQIRPLGPLNFIDNTRNARQIKLLSHLYLPEYEYTFWIDGNITIKGPITPLIDKYLQINDIALFANPYFNCIYEEAKEIINLGLDDPAIVEAHIAKYRARGYPENNGDVATTILRRNSFGANKFNTYWYAELATGSKRDQLSFNYVSWAHGIPYSQFDGSLLDNEILSWTGRHEGRRLYNL